MIKIPVDFYEVLRNKISISEIVRQKVNLTRKAGEYHGLCPFHVEKTPSFTVNDRKKFYHCFGCGAHGDLIKFVSSLSMMSYKESAIKLARDYGIELPSMSAAQEKSYEESEQIINILKMAAEFFKGQLSQEALNYLATRNITQAVIEEFSIGFAPRGGKLQKFFDTKSVPLMKLAAAGLVGRSADGKIYEVFYDRLIFPIKNIYGKIIAFGGRSIGEGLPKYLNSPETVVFKKGETLYGENHAISAAYKKNYSILVEGYLDVIALCGAGFNQAMASLGTAVTDRHITKLWRAGDEIIICLDGDNAGVRASNKVINLVLPLIAHNRQISFVRLPDQCDPDDIISLKGPAFFQQLMAARISLSEMIWHLEYDGKSFATPEIIASLEVNLANYCQQIKDPALNAHYRRFFKNQIWQNIISQRPKVSKNFSIPVIAKTDYSELATLEHALCAMLIRFPEITQKDHVKDFLLTVTFQNTQLAEFRDWVFTNIIAKHIYQIENIQEIVEKTRFLAVFLLLIKGSAPFLNLPFSKAITDPHLLWEWVHKKYYLVLLQQEYQTIIQNGSDAAFKKAMSYQKEIFRISTELRNLNQSLINY